mmetsp:Transcript_47778/g.86058  ORF Transcript_47778/g.86058 Transcript_47778/m.86058 type:complete len:258 (+) Transcript_47778:48-821(+)|eukprot:CAMPEP_0197654804 /NCGR_PEP_ID=MMETSP1338-20131121/39066_1 /TAXON_ID=43686 ORGANISM="Pelagodinium beii, Strain RCC1491" /NCGR_SAMPLE_ID=MMETSP1338 /ASSEMBLY_ACC=CAM_ASM_000754 /LENGTH=257 /DNA_ID=CAMNT_0043230315 /DNA_START=26 /DNA_END=799 /DNA_ORIENTATION=-
MAAVRSLAAWTQVARRPFTRAVATRVSAASSDWHERPKAWKDPSMSDSSSRHSLADVAVWRAEFGFAKRQHSLAAIGYTDDELLEWRRPFDKLAEDNRISFPVFEHFMLQKYNGIIADDCLASKVRHFWLKFDRDNNNYVDFGEFIGAGLLFDIDLAKEKIRLDGIEEVFVHYSEDGFMIEPHFFRLMCDFRFFVATATDVRKIVKSADQDGDGLVSLSDFLQWAESGDIILGDSRRNQQSHPRYGGGMPFPSPEPE